jgi:hypothetical protein
MLSPSQKNAIFNGALLALGGTGVHLMKKDRMSDPYQYPACRMSILTQGTKVGPSTGGPIQTWRDADGDKQQFYGDFRRATVNMTIECMSPFSGSDPATQSQLDSITYELERQIRFYGLSLYYPVDNIKVLNILATVPLPPFFDEKKHRWIYRTSCDILTEYTFQLLDTRPNIHAIDWDFQMLPHHEVEPPSPTSTNDHIIRSEVPASWYTMDVELIQEVGGNLWDQVMDMVLTTLPEHESSQNTDLIISW